MIIPEQLQSIGLHKSEINVYLYLLENGFSTPPQIAKGTNIARTNCYHLLQALKEKGLIEEQTKGKRKAYIASDPDSLLRSIERKKEAIERLLPDLRGLYTTQKNKPKITFYDGLEQIKEIYWQSLSAKKVYGIGSTKQLNTLLPKFFEDYVKELQKRQIVFYDLLTFASQGDAGPLMKGILKGLYDVKYLPQKYQDFPTDLLIWDDNVALITLNEPIFGTVLTNRVMASTFRTMFSILWDTV